MGSTTHPLNEAKPLRRTTFNRVFAAVYTCAIIGLLYHHVHTVLVIHRGRTTQLQLLLPTLALLVSDIVLALQWATVQAFRMNPLRRKEYPQNLLKVMQPTEFPALDMFICTADPAKEPPINVVNTALSVMAYDYPTDKLSLYVSDDGGSALTLFAFMEAAKFAADWLPFCRKHGLTERNPDEFFSSASTTSHDDDSENVKMMYESMKVKVERVVETGNVSDEYITGDREREALFSKWSHSFTRHHHPTVIHVLSETNKDRDSTGHAMPNLIYVSREKNKTFPHNFKAGALNVLLRVSAVMTNAPLVLTLDCDMSSNDPQAPLRVLCYVSDPATGSNLSFVQFPQRFRGLSANDIYATGHKRLFHINFLGMDGLKGPNYVGSGAFFRRRSFFGPPSHLMIPEIPQLHPDSVVDQPIQSPPVLSLAYHVAACSYEKGTNWGSKMGIRYGSLVEDYYTGYWLHCEGWTSIFCNPDRPAFYGDAPITLLELLNQNKRWTIGLLEVVSTRYCPISFGIRTMGLMGLAYAHYAFWFIWSISTLIYAFLPQLALINGLPIFPKISEPWFVLYIFLALGAYGQDCLEFVVEGGTFLKWWNDQRMWMIRGVTCYLFGTLEYLLTSLRISTSGFNLTSKVVDDEESKRYEQEMFDFGAPSPMFVPLATAAIVNLFSFPLGLVQMIRGGGEVEGLILQMLVAGFVTLNCWPIYEAMALRSDKGKMPARITVSAALLAWALYAAASLIF